jgi:DNA-directed RNA polymerase beta subunit
MTILEGADDDGEPKSRPIMTHRLVTKAKVVGIKRIQTHILGEPAERVRLKYECVYSLEDGDKVTTRHGHKGVVRILPDAEMPHVEMPNGEWRPLEALIHPLSLPSRRPLGTHREMVVNKIAMNQGAITVNHFSSAYSSTELATSPLSEKQRARIRGIDLQHPVFAGPLYWLRLDMHAREQLASCGMFKPLNFVGLNPDAGNVSGQRINLGVATVMHSKGLEETHHRLHRANVEKGAVRLIEDFMSVLAFKGHSSRRRT